MKKIIGVTIFNKKGFAHYPNGDAGKCRQNLFCEQHNRKDLKVHVKKLISQKRLDQVWENFKFTFFFSNFLTQSCSIHLSHERLFLCKKKQPQSKKQKTETIQDEEKEEECTNLKHHVEETIVGCFEEKNDLHLTKKTYCLCKVKCSKCKKALKKNLMIQTMKLC